MRSRYLVVFFIFVIFALASRGSFNKSCGGGTCGVFAQQTANAIEADRGKLPAAAEQVTFIELGSKKCIPCKMMQPIMKEIEGEYPDVKVVFYDVWTPEGQKYGQQYKVRVIPTQVFLDKDGKEYFRHEGFFPKEDLEKILIRGGAGKGKK